MAPNQIIPNPIEADLKVLYHLIYEYEKGVRPFVLYTIDRRLIPLASKKLDSYGIDFFLREIPGSQTAVNLFFGNASCVEAMQTILADKKLEDLSAEEDFILGAILGYDLSRQCIRYCKRRERERSKELAEEMTVAVV